MDAIDLQDLMNNAEKPPVVFMLDTTGQASSYALKADGSWIPGGANEGQGFISPYANQQRDLTRTDEGYAMAYMTCVWAFRGIQIRSQKVAELLRDAKLVDRDTGKVVRDTLYEKALDNAFLNYFQDFYEEWLFFKCLTGEAYIHKERLALEGTDINFPSGLRVLNSLCTEPNILNNAIVDYWYNQVEDSTPTHIPKEDMIYDKFRNPFDDLRGASLLVAGMDAINIDRSVAILNRNFVRNNARPGLIFTPKTGKLGQSDGDLIKTFVQEDVKGAKNAGRPLVMPYAMDVTVAKPPDLEDQTYLTDDQKTRVLAGVGVPMGMVDYGDMRYQMSPEQRRGFYTETVIPDAGHCAMVINAGILPFFDPQRRFKLELDLTRIMPILEDQQVRTNIVNIKYRSGLLSWNEARVAQGDKPVDGGDFYMIPEGYNVVKAEDLAQIDRVMANSAASLTADGEGPSTDPVIQHSMGIAQAVSAAYAGALTPQSTDPNMPPSPGNKPKARPGAKISGEGGGLGGAAGAKGHTLKPKSAGGDSSFAGSVSGLPKVPVPPGVTFHPHIDTGATEDFPFTKSVVEGWEKELKTWERFTLRNGPKKSQRFECETIPLEVASAIKTAMLASSSALSTKESCKTFFDSAFSELKSAAKPDKTEVLSEEGMRNLGEIWEQTGLGFLLENIDQYAPTDKPTEQEQTDVVEKPTS